MDSDIPTIDAIFVVRFDTRKGNVLEWSNCIPGIELRGVEFSALPSGLHDSSQDVIYFQLEGCIGVSVFANVPSSNVEHRGAQMVSVGVLVKPSAETGRCGQVWRHVDFLKSQAKYHADQGSESADLARYFVRHKPTLHVAGPSSSSSKRDAYRARNVRRISRSFTLSEPIQPITSTSTWQQEISDTDDIPVSTTDKLFLFKPQLYDVIVDFSAPVLSRSRRRQEWMQMRHSGETAGLEMEHEDAESMSISSQIQTLESDGFISSGSYMSDILRKMLTGGWWWWWYGGNDSDDEIHESLRQDTTPQSPVHGAFPGNDGEGLLSGSCLQTIHSRSSNPDTEAIRYFHNLTSTLLSRLARLVALKETEAIFSEESDVPTDMDMSCRSLKISNREIQDLGLDSHKDAEFVKEMVQLYFGFTVQPQGSEL
ncbi:hypothetical protein BGZ76_008010, partial [Entomortierella beljakovae]